MSGKRIVAPYEDLTYRIIGCCMACHRALGPGLPEKTYESDVAMRFKQAEILFEEPKYVEVLDEGKLIGYYILDFFVEQKVVVELKALGFLDNSHLAQVITYLVLTDAPVGLLIDFGGRSLRHRRILPPTDKNHRVNRQWLFVPRWLQQLNHEPHAPED